MFNSNNQNGFAVIYGLVVLFLTTIGGMTFLYLSGKDKESSGNYLQMRDATFASKAAHNAFISLCESNPKFLIEVLDSFSSGNNSPYKWLFGNTIEKSKKENKVKLWDSSGAPAFSVKITDYNPLRFIVKIEALGYGSLGGQKKSYGIYKLNGLEYEKNVSPAHALYLGGGFSASNSPLTITGYAFAGGNSDLNRPSNITIHGNFKTGTGTFSSDAQITVKGKAFFRGDVKFQASDTLRFNGKTGIQGNVNTSAIMKVDENLYLNGKPELSTWNITPAIKVTNGHTVYCKQTFESRIDAETKEIIAEDSTINISMVLQMPNTDDAPPKIHNNIESLIPSDKIHSPREIGLSNINSWESLNTAYNNAITGSKAWEQCLVIKVSSNDNMNMNINNSSPPFNGDVIWIMDNVSLPVNGKWYSSTDKSNTLIYLKKSTLNEFGFGEYKNFQGIIYCDSSSQISYKLGNNSEFSGSIIHAGNTMARFQGSNQPAKIIYNKTVARKFMNLGIFSPPSEEGAPPPKIILKDIQIRPYLISLLY